MSYDSPPSDFAGATEVGGGVFYGVADGHADPVTVADLVVWHWCTHIDRYVAASVANHTLVSLEPLHLEASLLWPCCGKHGFIRAGTWTDA